MSITSLQGHRAGSVHDTFDVSGDGPRVEVRSHRLGTEVARLGLDRWQVPAADVPAFVRAVVASVVGHEDANHALLIDLQDVLAAHGHHDPAD